MWERVKFLGKKSNEIGQKARHVRLDLFHRDSDCVRGNSCERSAVRSSDELSDKAFECARTHREGEERETREWCRNGEPKKNNLKISKEEDEKGGKEHDGQETEEKARKHKHVKARLSPDAVDKQVHSVHCTQPTTGL